MSQPRPEGEITFEQPKFESVTKPDPEVHISASLESATAQSIKTALGTYASQGNVMPKGVIFNEFFFEQHGPIVVIRPKNSWNTSQQFTFSDVTMTKKEVNLFAKAGGIGTDYIPHDSILDERKQAGKKARNVGAGILAGAGITGVGVVNFLPGILSNPVVAEVLTLPGGALAVGVGAVAVGGITKLVQKILNYSYMPLPLKPKYAELHAELQLASDYLSSWPNLLKKYTSANTVSLLPSQHTMNVRQIIKGITSDITPDSENDDMSEYAPYLSVLQELSKDIREASYTTTPAALVEEIIAGRPADIVRSRWSDLGLKQIAINLADALQKNHDLEESETEAKQQYITQDDAFVKSMYERSTAKTHKAVDLAVLAIMQFAKDVEMTEPSKPKQQAKEL